MKKLRTNIIYILLLAFLLTSCADVSPHAQSFITSNPYGFIGGMWHGMIIPFSWIGSMLSDDIAIYAYNNNGGWYNFGFVCGVGLLSGGSEIFSKD